MKGTFCLGKTKSLAKSLGSRMAYFQHFIVFRIMTCWYRFFVFNLTPFWVQLLYFISLSILGFFGLKILMPKTNSFTPTKFDMFFMSVSSVTVSSMSTVEMEVFSNNQLMLITILMLVGGEVFTSMLGLQFSSSKFLKYDNKVDVIMIGATSPNISGDHIELSVIPLETEGFSIAHSNESMRFKSLRCLGYVVLGYLSVVLVSGCMTVTAYLSLVSSASNVLKKKGLEQLTFSVFTVVSTFASCGFIPTNENMIVFKTNPGLLLLLIPQVLLGNTLYPSCLRLVIWLLGKITKKDEFQYMLRYTGEMKHLHLLPRLHSALLVFTVLGFILVQFILFCSMEWNSGALDRMTSYQKIVGALFQTVNTRHTGESIVDLSIISPAILVLFVIMMYLPPYTSFLPIKDKGEKVSMDKRTKPRRHLMENLLFSPLSYLSLFIIIICITEREDMKEDPLNFSVLNIVTEVISAYGNVGFSTGYSCKRQIHPDDLCKDAWYGFSGRFSNKGKMVIILVMLFGRMKNFSIGKGRAWKLL